jgi:hypothetical protein
MTETEEKKPFSRYILKDNGYGEYFVAAYSPHTDNYTAEDARLAGLWMKAKQWYNEQGAKGKSYAEWDKTQPPINTDNYTPLRWFTGRNAKITAEFYLKFLEEKELASPQNTNSENTNSGRSKAYDSAYDWNRLDYMVDRSTWK